MCLPNALAHLAQDTIILQCCHQWADVNIGGGTVDEQVKAAGAACCHVSIKQLVAGGSQSKALLLLVQLSAHGCHDGAHSIGKLHTETVQSCMQ